MQLGHNSKIDLIKSVPLFASKAELAEIASIADEIDLPAGKTLIKEGDSGHEFFVIVEGTADVERGGKKIAKLGPGDFFGEIALVEHERRTASVTATTPVRAIVMHSREFQAMRSQMPAVCARIEAAIKERSGR